MDVIFTALPYCPVLRRLEDLRPPGRQDAGRHERSLLRLREVRPVFARGEPAADDGQAARRPLGDGKLLHRQQRHAVGAVRRSAGLAGAVRRRREPVLARDGPEEHPGCPHRRWRGILLSDWHIGLVNKTAPAACWPAATSGDFFCHDPVCGLDLVPGWELAASWALMGVAQTKEFCAGDPFTWGLEHVCMIHDVYDKGGCEFGIDRPQVCRWLHHCRCRSSRL